MPDLGAPPATPVVRQLLQALAGERWHARAAAVAREAAGALELAPGNELLVAACGEGALAERLAERTGATVTGVDADAEQIALAEQRARRVAQRDEPLALGFECAPLEDLPHETGVFDAVVAEPTLAAHPAAERALAELVRVTRPMGVVLLVQLAWRGELGSRHEEAALERLGIRPLFLVEWKQRMRDAGLVELEVLECTARGRDEPVEAPSLTWGQKAAIVGRTWQWGGWRAARGAVEREAQLLRALSRERALTLQLVRGVKWPHGGAA